MNNLKLNYNIDLDKVQIFKSSGKFDNNVDEFGNFQLIFSNEQDLSGETHYTKLPLKVLTYSDSQIKNNNDIEFSELVDSPENTNPEVNVDELLIQHERLVSENAELNSTVNSLIERYENTEDKEIIDTMKDQIIDLRIQLKQGTVPSDFEQSFPFLPIT